MPIQPNTVHIVVSGSLAGGDEFSYGYWLNPAGVQSQATLDGLTSDAMSFWTTDFMTTTVAGYFPTTTTWKKVRGYWYAGGSSAALVSESDFGTLAGTAAATTCPNQVAICVSQRTGIPGRRNRGRLYLPAPTSGILAAGQLGPSQAQGIADGVAAVFSAHNNSPNQVGVVIVASQTGTERNDVTEVLVDTRLDTQRSRANKQLATAVKSSAVTPL